LSCTIPKNVLNDEWITTNQLAQIDQGHQVIISEGKYGTHENGTPSNYFKARNNGLGYSIFLPLISLPALKCINFFGDSFLFFLIEFWTILLIGISLFARRFFPEYSRIAGYSWTNITIIAAFALFFCNLAFYQAFVLAGKDARPEIAAIALTNAILLAALAVILYACYSTLFQSRRISLSAMIISICCSSFLFWTISAKDHMLMAFLFGVLIYCGIKYIYTDDRWYVPAFFIVIGLIAWARPEIAVPLFIAFLIMGIIKSIGITRMKNNKNAGLFLLLSPVFTIVGAIPFFFNNYFITNNPLLPPFTKFYQNITGSTGTAIVNSISNSLPAIPANTTITQNSFAQFFDIIISNYAISPGVTLYDLLGILFLPGNRSAAIFVLCPVLVIGFAFALLSKIKWNDFVTPEKKVVFFLVIISILLFVAYIRSLSGMNSSQGITPDIRYLSPIYLPFSILGVLLLQKCGTLPTFSKKGLAVLFISMGEIILILVTFFILFKPADKNFQFYISSVSDTVTCITFALVVLCILAFVFIRDKQNKKEYSYLFLHALIVVPLVWQLAMIFNFSMGINEGYTYWIPVVKTVMYHIQDFIV
jgi:4-amino-4-deoxy-L-arabinose transferase-like glycosyltransferase